VPLKVPDALELLAQERAAKSHALGRRRGHHPHEHTASAPGQLLVTLTIASPPLPPGSREPFDEVPEDKGKRSFGIIGDTRRQHAAHL